MKKELFLQIFVKDLRFYIEIAMSYEKYCVIDMNTVAINAVL